MIKPVITSSEIETTAQLAHKIWNQHYISIIGQDQVDYMVEKFQSVQAILEQFKKGHEYFLSYYQEKPSGYMALVADEKEKKLMISKIYVDIKFRGLKLGSELLNFAIQKAEEKEYDKLWLTVNKNNSKSIKWYEKRGFKVKEKIVMDIGHGFVMDDYVMEMTLD